MKLQNKIKLFLIIVFGITYPAWIAAAIISHNNQESVFIFSLHLLGGASPLIATVIYLMITKEFKDYWSRVINIKKVGMISWLVVLSPIAIMLIAQLIVFQSFVVDDEFKSLGILYGVGLLFFGPIPEEMGWRGVLFHNLYQISFKKAQFYMTLIWFLWHLPLFFIIGSYQYGLGFLTVDFMFFTINIILLSLIMGYLYVIGYKNIVLPILFHYLVNLFGEMFVRNVLLDIMVILGYAALLIALYVFLGHKKNHNNLETLANVS